MIVRASSAVVVVAGYLVGSRACRQGRPWSTFRPFVLYALAMHTTDTYFLTADGIDTADGRTVLTNWIMESTTGRLRSLGDDRVMTAAEALMAAQVIAASFIFPRTFRSALTYELPNGAAPGGVTIVIRATRAHN